MAIAAPLSIAVDASCLRQYMPGVEIVAGRVVMLVQLMVSACATGERTSASRVAAAWCFIGSPQRGPGRATPWNTQSRVRDGRGDAARPVSPALRRDRRA